MRAQLDLHSYTKEMHNCFPTEPGSEIYGSHGGLLTFAQDTTGI